MDGFRGWHFSMRRLALFAAASMLPMAAYARQPSLPDPIDTPGAVNPSISQANIRGTICQLDWVQSHQPSPAYVNALKLRQLTAWQGYVSRSNPDAYEEDHLIPLALGGAATDQHNLWPEPLISGDGWDADLKRGLERVLHRLVCEGRLPLVLAQRAIALDWTASYRQFVHPR